MLYSKFPLIAYYGLLVYAVAFVPGIAAMHFAWKSGWRIIPTTFAVLLVLAPVVAAQVFPVRLPFGGGGQSSQFIYALWFFPGLLVLLNKHRLEQPNLGAIACLAYLSPLLLVTLIANYRSGRLADVSVTIAAAVVIILVFRSKALLLPARVMGVALLILPLALSLGLRLPAHLAMARVCAEEAGMEVTAVRGPITSIAMQPEWYNPAQVDPVIACKSECMELLFREDLAAVEVLLPARREDSADEASRWLRYRLSSPRAVASMQRGDPVEDGICAIRLDRRCIVATRIDGPTATYLVRSEDGHPPAPGVERQAYEIVVRETGAAVAWTRSFTLPADSPSTFYDVPLTPFIDRRGDCGGYLLGFDGLIRAFLDKAR